MRQEKIMEAMNEIDDSFLAEAEQYKKRKWTWQPYVMAAAAVLVVGIIWKTGLFSGNQKTAGVYGNESALFQGQTSLQDISIASNDASDGGSFSYGSPNETGETKVEESESLQEVIAGENQTGASDVNKTEAAGDNMNELELNGSVEDDYYQLVIYEDNVYVPYESVYEQADESLFDEQLGKLVWPNNERTEDNEFAGTVQGNLYSLKNYDPSFLLGVGSENNRNTYIREDGMSFSVGSELLEGVFHLSDGLESFFFESQYSFDRAVDRKIVEISGYDEEMRHLIDVINHGEFLSSNQIFEEDKSGMTELFHLYFVKNDGMRVHLELYSGGYVFLYKYVNQYNGGGIKLPEEEFVRLKELLNELYK